MSTSVKEVTLDNFENGKLISNNEKPTLLMVTWDKCGACKTAKPQFNALDNYLFNLAMINVTDMVTNEDAQLRKLTLNNYDGSVPVFVIYDSDGNCQEKKYEHELTKGCIKYAHHKLTAKNDTDKFKEECVTDRV